MATKFVGENITCVKWSPVNNGILDKATCCVTAGQGYGGRSLCLWQCSTDKIIPLHKEKLHHNATSLSFISQYNFVVGFDNKQKPSLEVWNITPASELKCTNTLATSNRLTTHASTSDKLICSVGEDGYLQVHVPSLPKPVYSTKCEMSLHSCTFYLSNNVLVGTAAGQLHNFDTRQGDKPVDTMSSDLVPILGITAHNSQPTIVANARSDGSILIWDMRHNRFPLATFAGHASAVWEVIFEREKPDNLYTCSEDGQLLMWNGAALSGVGGILGGGGAVSPWLTPEISHQKMDVYNLLGSDNKLSINSFDVSHGTVVCGGARQTLFCVDSCEG